MGIPSDRVQIIKRESSSGGGDAADEQPWPEPIDAPEDGIECAGVFGRETGDAGSEEGCVIWREGGVWKAFDTVNGSPASPIELLNQVAGGGITAAQHRSLRQLIHFVSDGPTTGFTAALTREQDGTLFPTEIRWKENGVLLLKKQIERSAGGATNLKPTPITWTLYDTDGTTQLEVATDTITYTGIYPTGITRVMS